MDESLRHALVQQIGTAMSDISEDCYCAGWLGGTEFLVPELCRRAATTGESQSWGHGSVTKEQAEKILEIVERAGCWADLDEPGVGYEPFDPFPIPPEYLAALDKLAERHR